MLQHRWCRFCLPRAPLSHDPPMTPHYLASIIFYNTWTIGVRLPELCPLTSVKASTQSSHRSRRWMSPCSVSYPPSAAGLWGSDQLDLDWKRGQPRGSRECPSRIQDVYRETCFQRASSIAEDSSELHSRCAWTAIWQEVYHSFDPHDVSTQHTLTIAEINTHLVILHNVFNLNV